MTSSSRPESVGPDVGLVVPCFDEAERLEVETFRSFVAARGWLRLLFVDDGSRDATRARLEELAKEGHGRIAVLALPTNQGKAEAVRRGVERLLEGQTPLVGYWDADLATPLAELDRFRTILAARPDLEIVLGSRVKLLGHRIERHLLRHYFGRVAATLVSQLLALPVYDSQCGAKLFRATAGVRAAFETPFLSRWEFDVELLARWLAHARGRGDRSAEERLLEVPLREWCDVAGSRLRPGDFVRTPLQLLRILLRYGRAVRPPRY